MSNSENQIAIKPCTEALQEIILLVDEVTAGLATKRVTLEEKMIVNYLKELSTKALEANEVLQNSNIGSASESCHVLPELQELAFETKESLRDLLKIINFNLNFLEQYFEHEYYESLLYEKRYVARMDAVLQALAGK